MEYHIKNAIPLITADNLVVGAALKILILGGSTLTEETKQHASGCSAFIWRRNKPEILGLVEALEE